MDGNVELLTTRQIAQRWGYSERWFERFRETGGGPPYLKIGRGVRYPIAACQQWLESYLCDSTSEPTKPPPRSPEADQRGARGGRGAVAAQA